MTETTPHPDDPGPTTPPAWCEQEWCDGGWTCSHRQCVQALDEAMDDMAHDAARERLL